MSCCCWGKQHCKACYAGLALRHEALCCRPNQTSKPGRPGQLLPRVSDTPVSLLLQDHPHGAHAPTRQHSKWVVQD